MWGFKDTIEYFNTCFELFLESLEENNLNDLSIDRIDSSGKYEPGNIRFVSMKENLRNKDYVNDVVITNIETGEVVRFPSFFSISKEFHDKRFSSTGVWGAFRKGSLYKKVWSVTTVS